MLSCKEVGDLLSAYYDGELGVAASKQIEEHLAECADCRKELEEIKALSGEIKSLNFPVLDEKFVGSLRAAIGEQAQKNTAHKTHLWQKMSPYVAAAACFVVAVGIYTAHTRGYIENGGEIEPINIENTANEIMMANGEDDYIAMATALPTPEAKSDAARVFSTAKPTKTPQLQATAEARNEVDEINPNSRHALADDNAEIQSTTATGDTTEPPVAEETVPPLNFDEGEKNIPQATKEPDFGGGGSGGSSGGATSGASANMGMKVCFKLSDISKKERIKDILLSYGDVSESEGRMSLKVLAANYDACLSTLRSMGDLVEISRSGESGEYGFIEIEFEDGK